MRSRKSDVGSHRWMFIHLCTAKCRVGERDCTFPMGEKLELALGVPAY